MLVMERILCFGGTDGCEESPCRNLLPIFQKSFLEELVRREQLPKAFWAGSGCLIGGGGGGGTHCRGDSKVPSFIGYSR
jgi:hypothetical protein